MENGARGSPFTKEPGLESVNTGSTGRNPALPHTGAGETQAAPAGLVPAGGPVGVSVCLHELPLLRSQTTACSRLRNKTKKKTALSSISRKWHFPETLVG